MAGMRYRAGAIFAVVVFVLGVTAAVAAGWETSGGTNDKVAHEGKGKDDNGGKDNGKGESRDNGDKDRADKDGDKDKGDRDKDNGDKEKSKGKEDRDEDDEDKDEPTVTTPSAPGVPTTVQTTPSSPTTPLTPSATPPGNPASPEEPVLAEEPTGEEPELTTAAKRKKLAETGLDPALIAVLGALFVGGGALLFRRAFAR